MSLWDTFIGKLFMTFMISMTPVVELRGAIPIGTAHGLPLWAAIVASVAGNLFPVPFIILFTRKVFSFIRHRVPKLDRLINRIVSRADKKSDIVLKYEFWGLFILVAIPLPGTGAWTGALIAAMMNLRLKKAFPAITMGVLAAAAVIAFATAGVGSLL